MTQEEFLKGKPVKVVKPADFAAGGKIKVVSTPSNTPTPVTPERQSFGSFLKDTFFGSGKAPKTPTVTREIIQNTVGSEGVAGYFGTAGKAATNAIRGWFGEEVNNSTRSLQDLTDRLISQANALPKDDPKRQMLMQVANENLQKIQGLTGDAAEVVGDSADLSARAIASRAINTATTLAPAGTSKVVVDKGMKTFATTTGKKLVENFARGTGFASAQELREDQSLKDVVVESFKEGLTSAAVFTGLGAAGAGLKNALGKAPQRLYNSALAVTQKIIESGRSPSKALIEKGQFGSLGTIARKTAEQMKTLNGSIKTKLDASPRSMGAKDVLDSAFVYLSKKFGKTYTAAERRAAIQNAPVSLLARKGNLTVKEANALRVQLDSILQDRYYMMQGKGSLEREAIGSIAKALRRSVQRLEPSTKADFADLATYIRTDKLIKRAVAQAEKSYRIGLKDLLFGTLAGVASGGSMVAAGAAIVAEKAANSPLVKTSAAVSADRLNKALSTKAARYSTEAVKRVTQQGVSN